MTLVNRNSKKEIKSDIDHLNKMLKQVDAHLTRSDATRIEYIKKMISDWLEELQNPDTRFSTNDDGFFGGLLTACICIHLFDEATIIEEIMGTLGEEDRRQFIQFAKENGEYELAGLDEYEEFMRIRTEGQEDAS